MVGGVRGSLWGWDSLRIMDGKTIVIKDGYAIKTRRLTNDSGRISRHSISEASMYITASNMGMTLPVRSVTTAGDTIRITMDAGSATLFDYANTLSDHERMDTVSDIMVSLIDAVARLHDRGIAHLDIKPENIIVNPEDFSCQLIDFEAARFIGRGDWPTSVWGTPCYTPPEVLQGGKASFACDAYSGAMKACVATGG